jgi:capsular polysaccharide biosynthesis protein
MAIAFGLEFFNNTLRTQEDAEHYLGLPVLAAIPDLRDRPVALLS